MKDAQRALKKIAKWQAKLNEAQDNCPHTNKIKEHKSDTGNWCRGDSYWTEFKCPDCLKFWIEEGSK